MVHTLVIIELIPFSFSILHEGAKDLKLSAFRETGNVELLKVGETSNMAIPSQSPGRRSGGRCRD